jgi:hypothetical protein
VLPSSPPPALVNRPQPVTPNSPRPVCVICTHTTTHIYALSHTYTHTYTCTHTHANNTHGDTLAERSGGQALSGDNERGNAGSGEREGQAEGGGGSKRQKEGKAQKMGLQKLFSRNFGAWPEVLFFIFLIDFFGIAPALALPTLSMPK